MTRRLTFAAVGAVCGAMVGSAWWFNPRTVQGRFIVAYAACFALAQIIPVRDETLLDQAVRAVLTAFVVLTILALAEVVGLWRL